jgi:hypothetical protein
MRKHFLLLMIIFLISGFAQAYTINIQAPNSVLQSKIGENAVNDVKQLLLNAGVEKVVINGSQADVVIQLPDIPSKEPLTDHIKPYPYVKVPVRNYFWQGMKTADGFVLVLEAPGASAVSAGLYGLLQEILDFNFFHPRQTRYPNLSKWPITESFNYASKPRFDKMGFHLHTQHPLELTEALLDENFPGGEKRVRQYIDWLARNRQNYFEFCLLETINRKKWPAYAAKWVQYAKDRGIIPGMDLSLQMKQQVAFKLYRNPPRSFLSKNQQIQKRITQLTEAGWKVFNMEFSQTEFSSGNAEKKAELRSYIQGILDSLDIHLTGREHVVKPETMVDNGFEKESGKNEARDAQRGVMIHTVMFYTLNDEQAPVYGNKNLQHMRDMMLVQKNQRETWYYPESAYWITFDISVPMLHTTYLKARLEDILYCHKEKIDGHLTFSSGWEWGYWLIDWSIANWSWETTINGSVQSVYPEQYADKMFKSPQQRSAFKNINYFQEKMIKADNLIQFMVAHTVTDELPGKFRLPLHPRPEWRYEWLRNEAEKSFADSIFYIVAPQLDSFSATVIPLLLNHEKDSVWMEINDALYITALRANHRAAVLRFLALKRMEQLKQGIPGKKSEDYLAEAKSIRMKALEVVRRREAYYRYPVIEMTTQHVEHTAYHFGYLFPTHDLHFWEREEGQAEKDKWGFLFMNIWDVHRIIGITEK